MKLATLGLAVGTAALVFSMGCGASGPVPVAPKARRPKPKPVKKPKKKAEDCKPTVVENQPAAVPYKLRVLDESNNLSLPAIRKFNDAIKPGQDPATREEMIEESVDTLITSLKPDPYNVPAIYYLASAYAYIGRTQCAINLLERLALLRKLRSQRPAVEKKVDKLLGRGAYKNRLDVTFNDMRDDDGFREVVNKLVEPL